MNLIEIWVKSLQGMSLSPTERGMLKAMKAVPLFALSMLIPYANDILSGHMQIDWTHLVEVVLCGMVIAGVGKALGANSPQEQALSQLLEQEAQDLIRSEVGTITTPPQPSPTTTTVIPPVGPGSASPIILPGAASAPLPPIVTPLPNDEGK